MNPEKENPRLAPHVKAAVDALESLGGRVESQTGLVSAVMTTLKCGRTTAQTAINSACQEKKIVVLPAQKAGLPTGYFLPKDGPCQNPPENELAGGEL